MMPFFSFLLKVKEGKDISTRTAGLFKLINDDHLYMCPCMDTGSNFKRREK
jgi:hypothetical protein